MRNIGCGLLLLGLLACEGRRAASVAPETSATADSLVLDSLFKAPAEAAAPAAVPRVFCHPLLPTDAPPDGQCHSVQLAGRAYQVCASAFPDRQRPLQHIRRQRAIDYDTISGTPVRVTRIDTLRSLDVVYQFRLCDAAGKQVFSQRFRKATDFARVLGRAQTAAAGAQEPDLLGYLPAFQALAFRISLGSQDNSSNSYLLVLLDARTGRLRHAAVAPKSLEMYTYAPLVTADGQALLTGTELLRADGGVVNLHRPGATLLGAAWLNEQAALVAYQPELDSLDQPRPMSQPNMCVVDRHGQLLTSIEFPVAGYRLPHAYLPSTRKHYLFNTQTGRLCILEAARPTRPSWLWLQNLPRFSPPQKPTEISVILADRSALLDPNNRTTLYVDTVSETMRYEVIRPRYQ